MNPSPVSPVAKQLEELHRRLDRHPHGRREADGVPAEPDPFAICLVTADGQVYEVGESKAAFPLGSLAGLFISGLAMEDHSPETVLNQTGTDPAWNPTTESGLQAAFSLVSGDSRAEKLQRGFELLEVLTGRGSKLADPHPEAEPSAKFSAIPVTCRELGIMAATLANCGINPVTNRLVFGSKTVESLLSVMSSCGMQERSGEWLYKIGLPSAVTAAGGLVAVLPGRLALAVYSPMLDAYGHSARGVSVCEALSGEFDLHIFNQVPDAHSVIRLKCHAGQVNSSRVRSPEETHVLQEHGRKIKIYQLQGNLIFSTAEMAIREVLADFAELEYAILDCKRVVNMSPGAGRLLGELLVSLDAAGKRLVFTHSAHLDGLRRFLKEHPEVKADTEFRTFRDGDFALEWCENRLMHDHLPSWQTVRSAALEDYELFSGLNAEELAVVAKSLERRRYAQDETIVRGGERAEELFLLAFGLVSVSLKFDAGGEKRVATFAAGSVFGEMAVLDGCSRSAHVEADTDCVCDVLHVEDFQRIGEEHPRIKIRMLENLGRILSQKLRKSNREFNLHDR